MIYFFLENKFKGKSLDVDKITYDLSGPTKQIPSGKISSTKYSIQGEKVFSISTIDDVNFECSISFEMGRTLKSLFGEGTDKLFLSWFHDNFEIDFPENSYSIYRLKKND